MVLYYAALDFECTCCDQTPQSEWLNEIIEFPVVFVNSRTLQVDFSFHSYVKPIEQRALTDFCTQLTGIVQNQVTDAPELPDVLDMFQAFLDDHGLTPIGRLSEETSSIINTTTATGDGEYIPNKVI
ncbi:ERI1 exoribonuclease member 3 [Perkinsus olseni]|uniref:ERI1 exoribonuclease member 3 n=1 Tax=Perkinsus olseni TaxID=32597 RepID=A0A7J6P8Y8_PEROL|nr:ERI1 exoribonuclease member 3 [Perkinsus olseni]